MSADRPALGLYPRQASPAALVPRAPSLITARPRLPLTSVERGPQGPPGEPGAAFSGYGYVQYIEAASDAAATLAPGVRVPVAITLDPAQTTDRLEGVFLAFPFFDGSLLRARAIGDAYDLRLTMTVAAQVVGGSITVDATINGLSTLTDSATAPLSAPAGQGQRVAFRLKLFPKAIFVANGVRLYVTSTVAASITSESLVVEPLSVSP